MDGFARSPYLVGDFGFADLLAARAEARARISERVELFVGGIPWTRHAQSLQLENSGDDGGTTVTFQTKKPLDRMVDRPVRITLDDKPYFEGTLKRPGQEGGSRFVQGAVALGPFAEMASQFFGEQTSYTGRYLREALYDIAEKAHEASGVLEVMGGDHIQIEEADFTEETSLVEGATSLTTPSNFVLMDNKGPGQSAFRRPRTGGTGQAKRRYTPDDYEEGNFTLEYKSDAPYAKVVIFRRGENDDYDVRAVQPIAQSGDRRARERRIWYITDWPGTQEAADQEAYEVARDLEKESTFSLTVPLIYDAWRWDRFICARDRETPEGLRREWFRLIASASFSADLSEETMSLSGDALWVEAEPYSRVRRVPESLGYRSPYVVGVS